MGCCFAERGVPSCDDPQRLGSWVLVGCVPGCKIIHISSGVSVGVCMTLACPWLVMEMGSQVSENKTLTTKELLGCKGPALPSWRSMWLDGSRDGSTHGNGNLHCFKTAAQFFRDRIFPAWNGFGYRMRETSVPCHRAIGND